jgi:hypothetical protein
VQPPTLLLRHLAEAELLDAVHPDEYRQRFAAAAGVRHPHVAATLEVLEIAGRPAVLQEWVTGLGSSEWPALAAVPGVWFRLLCQAALGLRTAHRAGLVHGRLTAASVVLTGEGVVKLCGFGEPPWLEPAAEGAPAEPSSADDLRALGRLALDWSVRTARRKGGKPKPLPAELQEVMRKLGAAPEGSDGPALTDGAELYADAAALLDGLEQAGAAVPANAEAWDRLVRHAGDNAAEGAALRRSA